MTTTAKRQRQREGRVARMEAERKAAIKAARRRRVIMAVVVAAVVVGLMALVALLGGGDDEADQAEAPETTTTTAPEKPEVTIPETPPPTELQTTDITVGDGEEAQTGDTLEVHYVGKVYATGEEFDSSYDRDPIEVQLVSPSDIIPGWIEGLQGVRAGGRRQLVIPPDLGYGAQPSGDIPANSTLVFVIDVLDVQKAPAPPGG